MHTVVLLGPPGVGKGTVARALVDDLGFTWLSTGEIFRQAERGGSEFGLLISDYIRVGRLVPDEIVNDLVRDAIARMEAGTRLLFDGFPRTMPQAQALDSFLEDRGDSVTGVVELQAERGEIARRILRRSQAEGRNDDTLQTLEQRLQQFCEQTSPLVRFYEQVGKLYVINAMGSQEEVSAQVRGCVLKIIKNGSDGDDF